MRRRIATLLAVTLTLAVAVAAPALAAPETESAADQWLDDSNLLVEFTDEWARAQIGTDKAVRVLSRDRFVGEDGEAGVVIVAETFEEGAPALPASDIQDSQGASFGLLSTSCWSWDIYYIRTTAGLTEYIYAQHVFWCGDGADISSYSYYDYSDYTAWGNSYQGNIGKSTYSWWSGGKEYRRFFTQGKYSLAFGLWHETPWIKSKIRGDGSHWVEDTGH